MKKIAKRLVAVGYVRVSTDEQAEGFSIAAQEDRIRAYARSQDYELIEIYKDDGYSAKDTNRPGLQKLISDIKKKRKFALVLVYKIDRFSRRLVDLTTLVERLERQGIAFRSSTEPFATDTAVGKLIFNMLGSFAQFERELNGERTKLGMMKRLKGGLWNGRAPFGYKMEKGLLLLNQEEANILSQIFNLFLYEGLGCNLIAQRLNDVIHLTFTIPT